MNPEKLPGAILSPFLPLFWPKMASKVFHQYTGVMYCVNTQYLGSLGTKKGAKTDSEQLQNISQGLLLPLVLFVHQNGLKWPPKVYHRCIRVLSFFNGQDWDHWGLFGCNEFEILGWLYHINESKWSEIMKS